MVFNSVEFVRLATRTPGGKPKYRDPEIPLNTWSGRGRKPAWLQRYLDAGRDLAEFEIKDEDEDGQDLAH